MGAFSGLKFELRSMVLSNKSYSDYSTKCDEMEKKYHREWDKGDEFTSRRDSFYSNGKLVGRAAQVDKGMWDERTNYSVAMFSDFVTGERLNNSVHGGNKFDGYSFSYNGVRVLLQDTNNDGHIDNDDKILVYRDDDKKSVEHNFNKYNQEEQPKGEYFIVTTVGEFLDKEW